MAYQGWELPGKSAQGTAQRAEHDPMTEPGTQYLGQGEARDMTWTTSQDRTVYANEDGYIRAGNSSYKLLYYEK